VTAERGFGLIDRAKSTAVALSVLYQEIISSSDVGAR
jgi:hypothetical protein